MTNFAALLVLAPLLSQGEPRVVGLNAAASGKDVVITVTLTAAVAPALPEMLERPWRLYVDLPGARPGSQRQLDVRTGPVAFVRVALNRASPPTTRIVIELTAKTAWRMERVDGGRQLRVILADGAAATPSPGVVMYAPAPPVRDRHQQIREELFAMAGPVGAIRGWNGPTDAELATLMAAVERLSTEARAMQITASAHDLALVAAIDAVSSAALARAQALADGKPQSRANAIAAANGALLLLQHAQTVK